MGPLKMTARNSDSRTFRQERRPVPRQRVLLGGLIVYRNGAFTCDCTFRSLSATGARIAVAQLSQFPTHFYVINVRDGVAYEARVVWSKGLEMGIKFEAVLSLSAKPDFILRRLKGLWLAKAHR